MLKTFISLHKKEYHLFMKILPIIEKIKELNHQKNVLQEAKRDFETSITSIRKELFSKNMKSKKLFKNTLEYSDLEASKDAAKNCLNDIKEKIKKIKNNIRNLSHLYVSWNNIVFYDGYIKIIFDDYESDYIKVLESKSCFNYIRINIAKKVKPLEFSYILYNDKIIIADKITFENAIMYLSIKNELSQEYNANLGKIKKLMGKVDNTHSFLSLFLKKSLYLEFLANKQSSHYKIVPTEEKIKIGNSYITESSFIFTICSYKFIYIIWENINKERATFIFKTSIEEYDSNLQILFDYIVGTSSSKRKMLHTKQAKENILKTCIILYHTDYRVWENKLEAILI